MLGERGPRGTLFRDVAQLAEPVVRILRAPALKQRLGHNAYAYGRETAWPREGEQMLDVLRRATTSERASRAVAPAVVSSRSASGAPGRHADPLAGVVRP